MKEEKIREEEEKINAKQVAINAERRKRLADFSKHEERWIGSINFVRKGEIAEKDMLFLHPNDEPLDSLFDDNSKEPLKTIKGDEYAKLSGNEKKQVHKFIYDNY
jgi:hypothetical protein